MKRSQSIFLQYILILSLSISAIAAGYYWATQQGLNIKSYLNSKLIEEDVKYLSAVLNNIKYFPYAKEKISVQDVNGMCEGNALILSTGMLCKSNPLSTTFIGYIIQVNNQTYVFSNRTQLYYPIVLYNPEVFVGCFEGVKSYVINLTGCDVFCRDGREFYLVKNSTGIYAIQ